MQKKTKRWVVLPLAAVMMMTVPFSACTKPEEEGDFLTVTFDYNDDVSRPYIVEIEENTDEKVGEPTEPSREGYTFSYWQTEENGGEKVTFPYTPAADVTLYAKWDAKKYTVTLDYNYDNKIEEDEWAYGSVLETPDAPQREGFTLYEWTTQQTGGTAVLFPYTVKKDITLYAQWVNTQDIFKIDIDLNYPDAPKQESIRLVHGETVTNKTLPDAERIGYKLTGWSLTADGATLKLPYAPEGSCTLYAIWEEVTYSIAFRSNFVDAPKAILSTEKSVGGSPVERPETDPTREGYVFAGWYATAEGGSQIDFPFIPTKNTAIYAHWIRLPIETNIFQAEYVEFDPNEKFPGYSGDATGAGAILTADVKGVMVDNDVPLNSVYNQHYGHYVSFLYKNGATLTFVINVSEEVSNVTLKANLAVEMEPNITFAPTGQNAYQVLVNGDALNYTPIVFKGSGGGTSYKSDFREFTLSTTVSLKKGENVIKLVTANNNPQFGGTMKAVAPMVDYIKLENYGSAKLSWSPIYDNLYR